MNRRERRRGRGLRRDVTATTNRKLGEASRVNMTTRQKINSIGVTLRIKDGWGALAVRNDPESQALFDKLIAHPDFPDKVGKPSGSVGGGAATVHFIRTVGELTNNAAVRQYDDPGRLWAIDAGTELPTTVDDLAEATADVEEAVDVIVSSEFLTVSDGQTVIAVADDMLEDWRRHVKQREPVGDIPSGGFHYLLYDRRLGDEGRSFRDGLREMHGPSLDEHPYVRIYEEGQQFRLPVWDVIRHLKYLRGAVEELDESMAVLSRKKYLLDYALGQLEGRIARPRSPHYSHALENQLRTLEWLNSATGREMVYSHAAPWVDTATDMGLVDPTITKDYDETGKRLWWLTKQGVELGATYYWSGDMCEVLKVSAASMPNYILTPQMIPQHEGWVWFADPFLLPPRVNEEGYTADEYLLGFSWAELWGNIPVGDSGRLDTYNNHEPDDLPKMVNVVFWVSTADRHEGDPASLGWRYYGRPVMQADSVVNEESSPGRFSAELRYFAAAIAFMNQEIIVPERHRPDRATRRRWGLDKKPGQEREQLIRVVKLRRKKVRPDLDGGVDKTTREYHVRWLVRGHWRNQWYSSKNAHMPKWIHGYDKGPEGMPFKEPASTVFTVVR